MMFDFAVIDVGNIDADHRHHKKLKKKGESFCFSSILFVEIFPIPLLFFPLYLVFFSSICYCKRNEKKNVSFFVLIVSLEIFFRRTLPCKRKRIDGEGGVEW